MSAFTDIEADWEDTGSDDGSIFEEESPRGSFDTITSVDEIPTPGNPMNDMLVQVKRNTLGPSGPHLFGVSFDNHEQADLYTTLQMSPILPKEMQSLNEIFVQSPMEAKAHDSATVSQDAHRNIVRSWTTEQVCQWMFDAGFESSIIDQFEAHGINGEVLLDMKLADLKELGISRFGQRHSVWARLAALRAEDPSSPTPTVFEDVTRPVTTTPEKETQRSTARRRKDDCGVDTPMSPYAPRRQKVRKIPRNFDEALTPAESVSIVAIEQLLPKPHRCSRGEDCPKHKKQERLRKQIEKDNAISPANAGGHIWITGYFDEFGNSKLENGLREAEPSVVASSDLLGGQAQVPEFTMDKEMQRQMSRHAAQDSVQQYLTLQHMRTGSVDLPPTPPLETPQFNSMRDTVPTPRFGPTAPVNQPPSLAPIPKLQSLPKLAIPRSASAGPGVNPRSALSHRSPHNMPHSAVQRLRSPAGSIQRVGSPATLNDMPHRSISFSAGPARDMSKTVPPNMHFRAPTHRRVSSSRSPSTWQRNSFKAPLQGIPEYGTNSAVPYSPSATPWLTPIRSPIRVSPRIAYGNGTTHAGYTRRRKTKFLRHEWIPQHARLQGTTLALHASGATSDRKPLDTIDIDEFTIACSSVSSDSKLAAALKTLRIKSEKREAGLDDAAFVFQLIPVGERSKVLSMLRDIKGGNTHHFAVNTRGERVDWMREVMLAKAKREQERGYEVTIDGGRVMR